MQLQAEADLDEGTAAIFKDQKEAWSDLVRAVGNWHEEIMTYFETGMPATNGGSASSNQHAKERNREGRGYFFETRRTWAPRLSPLKHKKKALMATVSWRHQKIIGYRPPDLAEGLSCSSYPSAI